MSLLQMKEIVTRVLDSDEEKLVTQLLPQPQIVFFGIQRICQAVCLEF